MPRPLPLCLLLLTASTAAAAPPTVTSLTPHGAERGKPVDLTITGKDLTAELTTSTAAYVSNVDSFNAEVQSLSLPIQSPASAIRATLLMRKVARLAPPRAATSAASAAEGTGNRSFGTPSSR